MNVILAHGVGQVYELPIPLWLYLLAAAGTVLVSFLIRAFASKGEASPDEKQIAGPGVAGVIIKVLRVVALVFLILTVVAGAVVREAGFVFAPLSFWVGLVVGMTFLNSIIEGSWAAADPWATTERFYRIEDAEVDEVRPPWWLGAAGIYLLFWFELVSGVGFDSFWVVVGIALYSLAVFSFRARLGPWWYETDPFAILFGFAGRCAPLRLSERGVARKSPVAELSEDRPMPLALYAALFMVLASTTLDNVRETVGWGNFLEAIGVDSLPSMLIDSIALLLFTLPFYATFRLTTSMAHSSLGREESAEDTARRFGWSMIPIAIAYVLAHNAPLFLTGAPQMLRSLSDPFEKGWNLLGTRNLLESYNASPKLVWFLEIAIIVGGHILAVLAAHRTAVRLAADHGRAVRSQYALTVLMSIYTIATLWLLAQALVS
jgi:hypothetical protein